MNINKKSLILYAIIVVLLITSSYFGYQLYRTEYVDSADMYFDRNYNSSYTFDKTSNSIYDVNNYLLFNNSSYFRKNYSILRRKEVKCDLNIVPKEIYEADNELLPGYDLEIFGYDGDYKLFPKLPSNNFFNANSVGNINIGLISPEDIKITETLYNHEFGEAGRATVQIGNSFVQDVFITPLAYGSLTGDNRYSSACLVFIQFYGEEIDHKEVVFLGDIKVQYALEGKL